MASSPILSFFFFFFNDTATTEIYTLSLHDALPISLSGEARDLQRTDRLALELFPENDHLRRWIALAQARVARSEEHTSELQSQSNLVCRLLLEKKKKKKEHTIVASDRYTQTSDSRN